MKAFSLMEIIVSIVILSFVMITLLQIKSENIFLISKSNEKVKVNDYILLAIDFKNKIEDKNEEIDLYKNYKFENEDIRKELKDIKVTIKDEKIDSEYINSDFNNINITTFSRTFSLENTDIKKKLYSFKIQL
jgi:hypothetical protein